MIGIVIALAARREIMAFVRANRTVIWVEEILFLVFFALFLAIRFGNPDLWHPNFGGEKPMDFAYLNAIVKSTWFPPYDPWFAGGYINYYYFGQLITATLLRLSGIVPEVAYNLALPMYFRLTAMGAFSVVFNLVERDHVIAPPGDATPRNSDAGSHCATWRSLSFTKGSGDCLSWRALCRGHRKSRGAMAHFGYVLQKSARQLHLDIPGIGFIASLLGGMFDVVVQHQPSDIPIGWWYWNATRVIPDTINEFPFFTFLYADLHAHLMSLPFTLVVMGFAVNFVLARKRRLGAIPLSATIAYCATGCDRDRRRVTCAGCIPRNQHVGFSNVSCSDHLRYGNWRIRTTADHRRAGVNLELRGASARSLH